ncbi:uncharacterized protein LOC143230950, partial [Tachypleus tridentatus]|uniref:uncharacterized protein LOC143230950 n=1 Tax=Tachypleus tridentatus TaxID=6853 RepID=UPI003FD61C36
FQCLATTTTPAITTTTVVSTKTTTEPLKSTTTVSPISTTRERTTAVASPTTPQKSTKTTTQISTSGKTTTQRPTSIETTTQRPTSTKTSTKTSKSSKSTTQASANNETTTQASSAKTTTQTSTNNTTDASTTAILTSNTNAPSSKKTTSSSDKATSVQMTKTSSRETSSSTVGTQLESTSTKQKTSNTETVPQKTTTTTENTTTPEPVTTTVPPSPPTVPPTDSNDTSYEVTANYHIPNLKENGTSAVPEKAPLLSHGPLGFGYSVKVEESCLKFEDFEHEGDEDCWKNPSNCNKGVSLSIWERISFQRNDSTRRYIFSTGGKDEGIPGISLYYEGITLHALVSTGQEKWYTYAKGHLRNDTWNNIGIRWSQDSGLHVYVDAIHKAYVVYPEKTSGSVSSFQKTQLTVGCSRQEENAYVDYANGEFDEFAAWMWELERNEIAYFLGGFTCDPEIHPLKCETIPQSLKKTIETVDLNDMQVYDDSVKLLKDVSATIDENANELSEDGGSQDQSSGGTSSSGSSSNSENRIEKQQKVQEDMEAMSDIVKMVMQKTAVEPGISRNLSQNDLVNTYKFQDILSNLIGAYVNKREKVTQEDKQNIQALVQMYNKWALDKIGQTTYEKDAIDVLAISDNMVTESRKSNYKQLKQLVDETEHYFKFPGSSDSWDKVKEKWDSPEDYLSFPVDIFGDLDMSKEVHVIFTMQNIYHKIAPLSNKITGADPSLILLDSRILSFNVDPPHSDIVLQKSPIKCYLEHNYKRPSTGRKLLADTYLMTNGEIQKRYCVRWDEHLEIPGQSSKGGWTYEGCFTVNSTAESTECHCTRQGQYAVMAKLHKPFSIPPDPEWVKFLKWVLYGISGILLVVYIFTILFRRGLQEQFHLIRLNTALMATGALASFFASDWKRDDEEACRLLSGFIHFFYIAVASWFAIEAHALFSAIINGSVGGKLKCYIPIGYGIPGVILGVSIGIYPEYGYDYRCLVGPTCEMKWLLIGPILALGGITLIWSLITVCNLSTPAIKKHVVVLVLSAGTRALCVVSFLFVVTWIFGMLSFIDLGLDYEKTPDFTPIFQIMNSLLGVFIVVMMGFGSPHFRSALCSRGRSGGVLKRNQVDPFDLHDKAEIPKARKTFAA